MKTIARIALLSLALGTAGLVSEAAAQSPIAQWTSRMPMNGGVQRFDLNRDGRVDAIMYDVNRDGRVDAVRLDSNFDGYFDAVILDSNRDGIFESFYLDTNGNRVLDTVMVDRTGNGRLDVVGFDFHGTGQFSGWIPLGYNVYAGRHSTVQEAIGNQINLNVMNQQLMRQHYRTTEAIQRTWTH